MGKHQDYRNSIEDLAERFLKHCNPVESCEAVQPAQFTRDEACRVARALGVNVNSPFFDLEQFWMGMNVELEHGLIDPTTNVTNNDPILTGKIALAHLNEFPDYYTRLARMEREAKEYWRRVLNGV